MRSGRKSLPHRHVEKVGRHGRIRIYFTGPALILPVTPNGAENQPCAVTPERSQLCAATCSRISRSVRSRIRETCICETPIVSAI